MKKLLTILALSLLLFEGILAYDTLLNDGKAFSLLVSSDDSAGQIDIVKPKDKPRSESVEPEVVITANVVEATEEMLAQAEAEAWEEDKSTTEEVDYDLEGTAFEYHYSFLTNDEKKVYRTMVETFNNLETDNNIVTLDDDAMKRVAEAVRYDHPEIFYVEQIGYTHYTLGGEIQRTALNVTYSDTDDVIRSKQGLIDAKVRSILSGIGSGADDYEKTKYVYETVINMTDYDTNAVENQNIVSVLLNGRSVCAGYTRTVQYLLNQMGVETAFVEGVDLIKGEAHAWNLVKVNGQYYYIDATWGDTSYRNAKGSSVDGGINYGYLNITSEELLRNHAIKSELIMPECRSNEDNYYVREGLYFYTYDENLVRQLFEKAYANGDSNVNFKCSSMDLYNEMYKKLVTDQKVFELMNTRETISYSADEDERTLCFWL